MCSGVSRCVCPGVLWFFSSTLTLSTKINDVCCVFSLFQALISSPPRFRLLCFSPVPLTLIFPYSSFHFQLRLTSELSLSAPRLSRIDSSICLISLWALLHRGGGAVVLRP